MEKYADKLRAYLDMNPIRHAEGDSLLEELYWCYIESNTFESPELRDLFRQLYKSMPELSEEKFDEVFNIVSELATQQEKLAFQTGAKIGLRLAAELFDKPQSEDCG